MGILICDPSPNSSPRRAATASGTILPRITPTAMQMATQTVRYLSKKLIFFSISLLAPFFVR
ncbi:MAG: hypothetical protein ACD_75C00862G0001 [uncultured bacterium]|nr:MAG: hypothetical protein ACD_75C00862G0001 [uncultured bacterium]